MIPDQRIRDPEYRDLEERCKFLERLQEANRRYWHEIYANRIYFALLLRIQHPIFTWVVCLCCRTILGPAVIQTAYYQDQNRIAAEARARKLEQQRQQREEQNRIAAELQEAELEQEKQRREAQRIAAEARDAELRQQRQRIEEQNRIAAEARAAELEQQRQQRELQRQAAEAAIKQKIESLRNIHLSRLFLTQRSNHFLSVKEVEITQLNGEVKVQTLIDQRGQRHPISTVYLVEAERLPKEYVLVRVNDSLAIAIEKRWHLYRDMYVQMLILDSGTCKIGRMTRVSVKDVRTV